MKIVKFITAIVFLFAGFSNTKAQAPQKVVPVEVYYFHATKRCVTCEAVEAVTKEALKEYYGDKIKIKASGGIRTKEQVIEFIKAGADRIGTSSAKQILEN